MLTTAANFFSKDPEDFKHRYAEDKSLNKFLDDLSVLATDRSVVEDNLTGRMATQNNRLAGQSKNLTC